ncbi:MAG TPA: nucleoside 2-deoxyribosyltransferase [Nocardioidaceae bacterium]|nr:nucleoside 2-deoxyribosyltransferase [Nocardioidaceae bacterium]
MKLYLAGPLFTTPERRWNEAMAARLEAHGHEVHVPHLNPPTAFTAALIFQNDKEGIDWADGVVAIMDGADPDSGTCWECGYAYGVGKPVVLFRSDMRASGDSSDMPYNAMLIGSATAHVELRLASPEEAADAVAAELAKLGT